MRKSFVPILGVAAMFTVLTGCASIGPSTVARDRFDYTTAVSDSWKRQMLLNIVKIRYGDAPIFLDVASIINQYQLTTDLNASFGWRSFSRTATATTRGWESTPISSTAPPSPIPL